MKKYLVTLAFVTISTSASAQMGQIWQSNRDRAIDQMQRQHENLQQQMRDYNLYGGGDWYMYDDVYGDQRRLQQLQRQRRLRQLELDLEDDDE